MGLTTTKPKAWFDENFVLTFRADVSIDEARELTGMMTQAFEAGFQRASSQIVSLGEAVRG